MSATSCASFPISLYGLIPAQGDLSAPLASATLKLGKHAGNLSPTGFGQLGFPTRFRPILSVIDFDNLLNLFSKADPTLYQFASIMSTDFRNALFKGMYNFF
jgi:hypothetical protein